MKALFCNFTGKSYSFIKTAKVTKRAPKHKPAAPPEVGIILQAIGEKKGENLVTIDLRKTGDAVCDFFVICEASTGTQLRGIAENVVKRLQEETGEKPWHTEGMQQLDWILLDYVHVVVHLFRRPLRGFYQLEELWSDGIIEEHND